jgi:hypothetical protein
MYNNITCPCSELIMQHVIKYVQRSGGIAPPFLTFGTYRTGGWVGPTAGLDAVDKRKSLTSAGN